MFKFNVKSGKANHLVGRLSSFSIGRMHVTSCKILYSLLYCIFVGLYKILN